MNPVSYIKTFDHNGEVTLFFPGLEVISTQRDGAEVSGVIQEVYDDPAPRVKIWRKDFRNCETVAASDCYVPEGAKVHATIREEVSHAVEIPLDEFDFLAVKAGQDIGDVVDEWLCELEDRSLSPAVISETVKEREVTMG